jgi:TetR/AcrR family transcriptional regulator, transcriptional repressor of aconitase
MTETDIRLPGRGPYAKTALRRQQIIDEVLNVFDDLGFEGTSLRAIADAIGVTHPVLVHHFGTKEQLFLEVLREHELRFVAASTPEGEGFADALRRAAEYSTRTPGYMALLNSMVARALESGNDRSREYFSARYANLREGLVNALATARDAGTIRSDIPLETAAALFVAAADGLSTQWLLDKSVDLADGLVLLERLLEPVKQG